MDLALSTAESLCLGLIGGLGVERPSLYRLWQAMRNAKNRFAF